MMSTCVSESEGEGEDDGDDGDDIDDSVVGVDKIKG